MTYSDVINTPPIQKQDTGACRIMRAEEVPAEGIDTAALIAGMNDEGIALMTAAVEEEAMTAVTSQSRPVGPPEQDDGHYTATPRHTYTGPRLTPR